MLIFDAHLDLAWNAVEWNRNIELPISELRTSEKHYVDWFPGEATVTFPPSAAPQGQSPDILSVA
jgi:membrane dipeptidase